MPMDYEIHGALALIVKLGLYGLQMLDKIIGRKSI